MDPNNDQELLNLALSDTPPAEPPATPPAEPPPAEPAVEADGQPRDEQGRFAPKESVKAETPPAQPPVAEPAKAPLTAEGQDHRVPIAVMHKERDRAQRAEQERDALRAQLEYAERVRQSLQQAPQVPQPGQPIPGQPAAPPPNVFEDPDAFVDHRVQPLVKEFRQVIQTQNDRWEALSREIAYKDHGKEKVDAAQNAMKTALQSGDQQARMEYQRIVNSVNPYGELMAWNQRVTTLQQVGPDPQAWLNKQLEEKLNDPAFLQKALDAARAKAGAPDATGARPPTAISLPPSLRNIPSGSPPPATDVDPENEAALLENALAPRKRR